MFSALEILPVRRKNRSTNSGGEVKRKVKTKGTKIEEAIRRCFINRDQRRCVWCNVYISGTYLHLQTAGAAVIRQCPSPPTLRRTFPAAASDFGQGRYLWFLFFGWRDYWSMMSTKKKNRKKAGGNKTIPLITSPRPINVNVKVTSVNGKEIKKKKGVRRCKWLGRIKTGNNYKYNEKPQQRGKYRRALPGKRAKRVLFRRGFRDKGQTHRDPHPEVTNTHTEGLVLCCLALGNQHAHANSFTRSTSSLLLT